MQTEPFQNNQKTVFYSVLVHPFLWIFIISVFFVLPVREIKRGNDKEIQVELLHAQERKKYAYIGSFHCRTCHLHRTGDQYGQWMRSAHKRAYQSLSNPSDRLTQVQKKYNIEYADTEARCLRCHTSAGQKLLVNRLASGREVKNYEGVGCEACHGPAEKYIEPTIHLSPVADKYQHLQKYGMWPVIGDSSIAVRERMCLRCHRPDRMCKLQGVPAKEISLPTITNFRHDQKYN